MRLVTKTICNKGFSGNSSILPRSNFSVFRQESNPQSLSAATLNRCVSCKTLSDCLIIKY